MPPPISVPVVPIRAAAPVPPRNPLVPAIPRPVKPAAKPPPITGASIPALRPITSPPPTVQTQKGIEGSILRPSVPHTREVAQQGVPAPELVAGVFVLLSRKLAVEDLTPALNCLPESRFSLLPLVLYPPCGFLTLAFAISAGVKSSARTPCSASCSNMTCSCSLTSICKYNRTIIFWPHIFVPSAIMSTNFLQTSAPR
ncbi:hypothetical protein KC323_g67 [Hortaea werneckii]|nr:hypothetical protein KC323_g67 [Hortaea werneckii]